MATLTIRNLPDGVHRKLKRRAGEHGHSTEQEVRLILAAVVEPPENLADMLLAIGKRLDGTVVRLERDRRPLKPDALT